MISIGTFNTEILLPLFLLNPSLSLWNPTLTVLPIRVHDDELLSIAWNTDAPFSSPSYPPICPNSSSGDSSLLYFHSRGEAAQDVLPLCDEEHPFQHPFLLTSWSAMLGHILSLCMGYSLCLGFSSTHFSKHLLSIYFVPHSVLRIQKRKEQSPPSKSLH